VLFAVGIGADVITALVAGKMFDKVGFPVLLVTFGLSALFAPFVFLGNLSFVIVGLLLWGIGLAAQESLMKAALADLIPRDRRAYGFGRVLTRVRDLLVRRQRHDGAAVRPRHHARRRVLRGHLAARAAGVLGGEECSRAGDGCLI
jgi:hypothetical protein